MNAKFIKFVLIMGVSWVVLVYGLLLNVRYLDNIALAYLWFIAVECIILGVMSCSDSFMDKARSGRGGEKVTKLHRAVSIISRIFICVLAAATGHFVLLSFLIVGFLLTEAYMVRLQER